MQKYKINKKNYLSLCKFQKNYNNQKGGTQNKKYADEFLTNLLEFVSGEIKENTGGNNITNIISGYVNNINLDDTNPNKYKILEIQYKRAILKTLYNNHLIDRPYDNILNSTYHDIISNCGKIDELLGLVNNDIIDKDGCKWIYLSVSDENKEINDEWNSLSYYGPIKNIIKNFIYNIPILNNLKFTGLNLLENINNEFFISDCNALINIDFNGLNILKNINSRNFIINCPKIETINFSGLNKLEELNIIRWLYKCSKIKTIIFD